MLSGYADKPRSWTKVAEKIQSPTLLITGNTEKEAIVTPELAKNATQINANIEVAYLDAEHSIRREVFDEYIAVVKAFLSKE